MMQTTGSDYSFENYTLKFWRKLFHVSSSWVGLVYIYSGIPHKTACFLVGGTVLICLLVDLFRKHSPAFAGWMHRSFRHLFIDRDSSGLNSATWYALSIFLVIVLFGGETPDARLVAGVPVLFLAWGDTAASVAGKLYGKRRMRFLHGTYVGFLACTIVSSLVCLFFQLLDPAMPQYFWLAPASGLTAAVAESLPLPLDDNLTVIFFGGFLLHLVYHL